MADELFPTRVQFFDGQYLEAGDLIAEQRYHLRMRWRHNLALHSWGILTGLEVTVDESANGSVTVARGMALDGYGRELVLARDAADRGLREPNADYDVLLVYSRRRSESRETESPGIVVTKTADRLQSRPDRPGEVPAGDLDFRAEQLAPDDIDHPWPVLLGRLTRREGAWTVDAAVRRYAGIVAERIEAPARPDGPRTAIVAGCDPAYPAYRFAVVTGGDAAPPVLGVRKLETGSQQIEFRAGRMAVAAEFVLRDGSTLEFQANRIRSADDPPDPIAGEPWRIYRHLEPPPTIRPTATAGPAPSFADELRIAMPARPVNKNRVAIGTVAEGGAFAPILTVANDGTVTVNGNLTVKGAITQGRIADAPSGATVAPAAGPSDDEILSRAAAILGRADARRIGDFLGAIAANDTVKEAIAAVVPTLDDERIKAIVERFWSDDVKAKVLGESATGARVGTFKEFLSGLPAEVKKDTSGDSDSTNKVVKVVGDWLFTRSGNPANPIATIDFNNSTDRAIEKFAAGIKPSSKLQKLLDALIDDTTRTPFVVRHFDDFATAVGTAYSSKSAGAFAPFLAALFAGSTDTNLTAGGAALATALLDHPGRTGSVPHATKSTNLGIRAIVSALIDTLALPLPTTAALQADTTRFRRVFDYGFRGNADAEADCKTFAAHVGMYVGIRTGTPFNL